MAQSLSSLSTRIEDSRDVLKAMILQEEKYYKCPNYLSLSTDTILQAPVRVPTTPSSLKIVEEIASLVTDVRYAPPLNSEEDKHNCISPGSSICDLYEDTNFKTRTSLPQHFEEAKYDPHQQHHLHLHHHLHHHHHHHGQQHLRHRSSHETLCLSAWRHQMFVWACAVCQSFDIDNMVLEVAFNVLDRYIAVELSSDEIGGNLPVTREDFQLFSMVSIYIASKVFNRNQKLKLHDLINMAQGYYTVDDITTTELDILSALDWHVHPPTVIDYCDIYLTLLPQHQQQKQQHYKNDLDSSSSSSSQASLRSSTSSSMVEKKMLECKCKHIAEVALNDVFFLDKAHSVIALAVVLLATDASRGCGRDPTALQTFLRNIQGVVNVHKSEFDSIIRRLECSS